MIPFALVFEVQDSTEYVALLHVQGEDETFGVALRGEGTMQQLKSEVVFYKDGKNTTVEVNPGTPKAFSLVVKPNDFTCQYTWPSDHPVQMRLLSPKEYKLKNTAAGLLVRRK